VTEPAFEPTVPDDRSAEADTAVITLLRNRIRYAPEVVAQVVIELAYDGQLTVWPSDSGRASIERTEPDLTSTDPVALSPWGRILLDRLFDRAVPGHPTPLSVLTTVDGDGYWDWRGRFEKALVKRAEQDGLIERRLSLVTKSVVVSGPALIAGAAVGTVVGLLFRPSPGFGAALATAFFSALIASIALLRIDEWRLSESGERTVQQAEVALAGRELVPGSLESAIRAGVDPLPADHIWSSHGGSWRVVGLGSRFGDAKRMPSEVLHALPERQTLVCQVVKRWYVPGGRERSPAYCCAFDDGSSSFTWTFDLSEKVWHALSVGDLVRLDFSPRRHKLHEVTPLDAPAL